MWQKLTRRGVDDLGAVFVKEGKQDQLALQAQSTGVVRPCSNFCDVHAAGCKTHAASDRVVNNSRDIGHGTCSCKVEAAPEVDCKKDTFC